MSDDGTKFVKCTMCGVEHEFFALTPCVIRYYKCNYCRETLPQCPFFRSYCLLEECTSCYIQKVTDTKLADFGKVHYYCKLLDVMLPVLVRIEE
jgi:hypothetical protein